MRWLRTIILFDRGNIASSEDWRSIHQSFVRSIEAVHFPPNSGSLTLRRKRRGPDGKWIRNGVVYLKRRFLDHLVGVEGWRSEHGLTLDRLNLPTDVMLYPSMERHLEPVMGKYGPFDFATTAPGGTRVAIEWETGNISSSHRSVNKLAIGVESGQIHAGLTIVPSRDLYAHLTDRIGNINELSGYLAMWKGMGESVERGLLAIVVVEHDALRDDGEYLPVGNDGRAAQGRRATRVRATGPALRQTAGTRMRRTGPSGGDSQ